MSTHGKQAVSKWQTSTQTQIHVIVHIHMERHKHMIVIVHRDTGKNTLDCKRTDRDRDMHAKNQKFRAHQVNKNTKTQPSISMYIRHVVSSNIDKIRYA